MISTTKMFFFSDKKIKYAVLDDDSYLVRDGDSSQPLIYYKILVIASAMLAFMSGYAYMHWAFPKYADHVGSLQCNYNA